MAATGPGMAANVPGGGVAAAVAPREAMPERAPADGPAPTVVVAGSAARVLDPADGRGWHLGGEAVHGALLLARLGLRVGAVVGVDEPAAGAAELDLLRGAGVDLRLVRLAAGPVIRRQDAPGAQRARCDDVGAPLPVSALPRSWRAAPAWHLAPVADELPGGWAAIAPGAVVALAWQGILRTAGAGDGGRPGPPASRALARRADLVGVACDELERDVDLRERLRQMRTGALCILAGGSRGGIAIAVRPDAPRMRCWSMPPRVGTSLPDEGLFLAAVLAARIAPALAGRQPHLPSALAFAAAVTSARRRPGLAGVPTLAAVRDELRVVRSGRGDPANGPPGGRSDGYDGDAGPGPEARP